MPSTVSGQNNLQKLSKLTSNLGYKMSTYSNSTSRKITIFFKKKKQKIQLESARNHQELIPQESNHHTNLLGTHGATAQKTYVCTSTSSQTRQGEQPESLE